MLRRAAAAAAAAAAASASASAASAVSVAPRHTPRLQELAALLEQWRRVAAEQLGQAHRKHRGICGRQPAAA